MDKAFFLKNAEIPVLGMLSSCARLSGFLDYQIKRDFAVLTKILHNNQQSVQYKPALNNR
jgi:hypothetical protein